MKELLEALGPWPTVQGIAIGIIVAGIGIWAMRRGLQDKRGPQIDDLKARWKLAEQVEDVHSNSFLIVEQLKRSNDISEMILGGTQPVQRRALEQGAVASCAI